MQSWMRRKANINLGDALLFFAIGYACADSPSTPRWMLLSVRIATAVFFVLIVVTMLVSRYWELREQSR